MEERQRKPGARGGAGAMPKPIIVVQTAFEERSEAERMAERLVAQRLAACVQISGPVRSIYRWEGEVRQADEFLLTIKAPGDKAGDIERYIEAHHSYDTPEVVTLAASAAARYREWVDETC